MHRIQRDDTHYWKKYLSHCKKKKTVKSANDNSVSDNITQNARGKEAKYEKMKIEECTVKQNIGDKFLKGELRI